jgi:hypothetical protein
MSDTRQPQPAGTETTSTDAAAALAEIQRRQEQVIKATLLPAWAWWVYAAAIIAIGVGRDSRNVAVQATVIPLAALVIVILAVASTPTWRHRVRVNDSAQPDNRVGGAIILMIVLVDAVIISIAVSLAANHIHYPGTISCAAGSQRKADAGEEAGSAKPVDRLR